jgi:uncharacterized protein with von Willebrand factor type A (vWA) domain
MRPPEAVLGAAAVALGRALREKGIGTGIEDELIFCRALGELDPARRAHVYWAARAAFLRDPDHLSAFEQVFARFWAGSLLDRLEEAVAEHGESDPRMPAPQHGGTSLPQFSLEQRSGTLLDGGSTRGASAVEIPAGTSENGGGERRGVLAAYSPEETVTERERLAYAHEELAALRRTADALRLLLPMRRSRRPCVGRRGERLDVRRTLRRSLATDGETLRLDYVSRSLRPRRLLFLCDVSGSMERFSRALLGSLQAAVSAGGKTEAFVFATRLTRLTRELAARDVVRALDEARAAVADWSGGTRIGQTLADFRRSYGPLGLARGAIVVVISDGWDRGDPDLLAHELAWLRLQCRRLVWVSPRVGELGGQPLAVGLQTALPYLDDFVSGLDPRAVTRLAGLVGDRGNSRPARAQRLPSGRR